MNGAFDPKAKSGIVVPADALAALKANGVPDSQINNLANLKGSDHLRRRQRRRQHSGDN